MKHYLEYLETLQKEMNLVEEVSFDKLKEYRKLYSKYNALASLFGFMAIMLAFSTIFVVHFSIEGPLLTIILSLFSGGLMVKFGGKAEHYSESLHNERNKVYDLNYSNIKNIIINDGNEHMQQLVMWERMCELSVEDEEKYTELLRIIHDVCREYVILWG